MKHILKDTKGQSLIEIVVAVGIIAVVLVGVSDLISRSLSLASFQAGKNAATNIAQNQLNHYRQARDLEPTLFFQSPNPQSGYSACVDNPDPVKYVCTITYDSTGIASGTKMTVKIVWKDADKEITTEFSQILAKLTK
ncbi:MAG: prepilin-type N-terminal cleavage/methylation domain-containing protein [Microgenomates group bacterium]